MSEIVWTIKCVCVSYVRMNIILRDQSSYIRVCTEVDCSLLLLSLFLFLSPCCVQYLRNQGETFFASFICNRCAHQPIRQTLCNQPIISHLHMFSMSLFTIIPFNTIHKHLPLYRFPRSSEVSHRLSRNN